MNTSQIQEEVDRNYEAFTDLLPELLQMNPGQWALLHNAELVAVFDTAKDAQTAGRKLYTDELFSIQLITNRALDLGWFSNAMS